MAPPASHLRPSLDEQYILERAAVTDLPLLYRHYETLFGSDLLPQARMERWLRQCPDAAWNVYSGAERRLIGFFDIEPLTASGTRKLTRPDAGLSVLDDIDIASSLQAAESYYVGSIGAVEGSGSLARTLVLACFFKHLARLKQQPLYWPALPRHKGCT